RVDVLRVEVPMRVLVGHPLLALDLLEPVEFHHPAGRLEVVQDRLVAGEALETHHFFGQQSPVLAELNMPLARDVAEELIEGHAGRLSPHALTAAPFSVA